jgi:photosystem II stability/assembly factor-like uncharacterized protein
MKKRFKALTLLTALSIISTSVVSILQTATAQSIRPYVVLVNGYNDCCVWNKGDRGVYMSAMVSELHKSGAEFRLVPWDSFGDGAGERGKTSNDAPFLSEAADFINNQLSPDRPLILIGHSYGGDSLLSLAPRIKRRVQFLGVLDPVAAGGLRLPVTGRGVPSNVDYFFNRWQRNGLNSDNVVPFDSRTVNGSISACQAKTCDQEEQNLLRNSDGSENRVSCGASEVSCTGWRLPGCNFGGCWKGSNGTKAKRLTHNEMPTDGLIQKALGDKIQQKLTAFQSPSRIAQKESFSEHGGIRNVNFISENIGTAVGDGGVIFRTGNGGASWVSQNSGVSTKLNAVHFSSENIGTAVGDGGVILRTGDGTASWVRSNSGVSTKLNAVYFTSENVGTAVGDGGVILRTGDGTASWVRSNSGASTKLNAVHFSSENVGTAVGDGGVILRTGDGTASWVRSNSGASTKLNAVHFSSENIGTAVGDNGVILRTGDGTASWVRQNKTE